MSNEDSKARRREHDQAYGFEPDVEKFEYFGCFTFDDAKQSLFESTRSNPIPVYLTDDRDGSVRIPVVIDLIRPSYIDIGEEDYPDWVFEGWVVPNFYLPLPKIRRVRIVVHTLGRDEFRDDDMYIWTWITDPADDPSD